MAITPVKNPEDKAKLMQKGADLATNTQTPVYLVKMVEAHFSNGKSILGSDFILAITKISPGSKEWLKHKCEWLETFKPGPIQSKG